MNAALLKQIISALEETPGATVIIAPGSSWNTLGETLELDAQSSRFDLALRKEIQQALERLTVLEAEEE